MTKITTKSPAYIAARKILGDHRSVYESIDDAIAALRSIYLSEGFPQEFPIVAAGIGLIDVMNATTDENNEAAWADTTPPFADWPSQYKTPGVSVCVSFIGVRGIEDENGKQQNGAAGFSVYPLHSIDSIQADEAGTAWLWKVVEKEASHVALRQLRNVVDSGTDALAAAASKMPLSVSDYVEESASESSDTAAFDLIWTRFRKMLAENPGTAAIAAELGGKAEVLKCIRSKAYAAENFERLESIDAFVFIATKMIALIDMMREKAVTEGAEFEVDSDEMRGWLAKRNEYNPYSRKAPADLSTVNLDAFKISV